ncbi:MAG: FxsA family protein [Betaproteobacteria bacterium]
MRFVLFAILVGFPVLDLYASLRFAHWSGVPLWAWLTASTLSGFMLLRSERGAFRAHTVAALHGEQPLFRGLVDSGRKVLAGLLFIMPGVISDAFAVALLLLPINTSERYANPRGADAIEGDFRRNDR